MRSFLLNMCCGDHTGRLLAHQPYTGDTSEIISGLWYANGVSISHDEKSVLVRAPCARISTSLVLGDDTVSHNVDNSDIHCARSSWYEHASPCVSYHDQVVETMGFRVVRHWLDGPNKGQTETFLGSLPGFPDGITRSANNYEEIFCLTPKTVLIVALQSNCSANCHLKRVLLLNCRRRWWLLGILSGSTFTAGEAVATRHYGPLRAVAPAYVIDHKVPTPLRTFTILNRILFVPPIIAAITSMP